MDSDSLPVFVITPFNRLSESFSRTYDTVNRQSYKKWVWILVNDCSEPDHNTSLWLDRLSKDKKIILYCEFENFKSIFY